MLAPIAQITGVLGRLQQAKVAKSSLDELMKKPVDQPDRAHLIHRSVLLGDYQLNGTLFKYNQDDAKPNLAIAQLAIRAGENCNFRPKWRGEIHYCNYYQACKCRSKVIFILMVLIYH
jgi:ABC-type bacteriocin/lantibiotic exporter with double-glycine peptidase domain